MAERRGGTPESFIRIIHVDDDEEQLLFTRVFLLEQDEDFEVISANNTDEAIHIIKTMGERFSCAFTFRINSQIL